MLYMVGCSGISQSPITLSHEHSLTAAGISIASSPTMHAMGDAALLVRWPDAIDPATNARVLALLAALDRQPIAGIVDLVPAYASLLVIFDPLRMTASALRRGMRARLVAFGQFPDSAISATTTVEIPMLYGGMAGPDLADVARELGITPAEVVRRHTMADYRVYFLGFIAGFPYMGSVDAALLVPRLATPRTRVPAGSVGLADAQTGIYPQASPGGWRIIGRTARRMFDPARDPPALLRPGDHVRFTASAPAAAPGEAAESLVPDHPDDARSYAAVAPEPPAGAIPWMRVLEAGPLTTVQDGGRVGWGRYGLSPSGAADGEALLLGDALLGNPPDTAALEMTMRGGVFTVDAPCVIALTGGWCDADVDGRVVQHGVPTPITGGARLTVGPLRTGARAYLHVAGGIAVAPVLGSRATDARAGLGGVAGRAVVVGDTLWRGRAPQLSTRVAHPRRLAVAWRRAVPADSVWLVRVLPCIAPGDVAADFTALTGTTFHVDPRSDRMGVRLRSPADAALMGGQILSAGVPRGAVQVPPDGNPIVLLAEHQTTGGYRVPAVVISPDQWQVAQMRPGDAVRFVRTTQRAAVLALRERRAAIAALADPLPPVAPDRLMRGFCEACDDGE